MEKYEIERLNSLPIESVASRLGMEVSHHKCLCPFHTDKHPSLTFNTRRNRYRCFVCGAAGGPIDLVMRRLGKGFREACEWLADEHNIILSVSQPSSSGETERERSFDASRYERFFEHPWLSPEACHFLFDVRHLDPRVVRWCRLNSYTDRAGIPWLQIPYYDQQGKLIGVQSRNLTPSQPPRGEETKDSICCSESGTSSGGVNTHLPPGRPGGGQPRFRFPYGSRCSIYNLQILAMLKPGESLYFCEGCSDCWSLLSAGHKAIAIPSATLLKPEDFAPICELGLRLGLSFEMYPDQDEPGERLFLQLRELMSRIGLRLTRHSLPTGCKDYSDYYCKQQVLPSTIET